MRTVDSLAYAVSPLVPSRSGASRGGGGGGGQATLTTPETWLRQDLDPGTSADAVVLRYLAAFVARHHSGHAHAGRAPTGCVR